MRVILFILAALAAFIGAGFFSSAQSSIQQIGGLVAFVVAAVLLGSASIVDAIRQRSRDLETTEDKLSEIASELKTHTLQLRTLADAATRRPDLPPLPGSERYYLGIDGQIEGPHDLRAVLDLRKKSLLAPDSLILREGTQNWQPVSSLPQVS